jgi:p-aminobenzoyl-glutamate transporter AbgT
MLMNLDEKASRATRKAVPVFLVLCVFLMAFSGQAAAAQSGSDNILCKDNGEAVPSSENLVTILADVVSVFMVFGPVAGVVVALYASVASSATPSDDDKSDLRRNSLLAGFSVPIIAYGLEALAGNILNEPISCIIP